MPGQQPLFTGNTTDARGPVPAPRPPVAEPDPAPIWLQRASLIMLVVFCFYIGGLLTVLPWSPRYWDDNGWMLAHPLVETALNHGWVRGLVSGIGLLDIWIGISELIHYRDYRP